MKILALFLVSVILLSSCAKTTNSVNSASETDILQTQIRNSQIVLEIQEDAIGMWDVTGKTLFFRLYDSRIVEFEYPDDKKKRGRNRNKAEEINSLKQIKISEAEFKKFPPSFYSKDFQIVKENYQRKCCCTDAYFNFKISFKSDNKQKTIGLNGYCDLSELTNRETRNSADIPIDLSELINLAYITRLKYNSQ